MMLSWTMTLPDRARILMSTYIIFQENIPWILGPMNGHRKEVK